MVSFSALSIFLLLIATVLGSQFWEDVDELHNELLEAQKVEPTSQTPQRLPSPNRMDEKQLKHRRPLRRRYYQKNVTLTVAEVETFKREIIIDNSYPQNTTIAEIEKKILALESLEEWSDLDIYDLQNFSKYWGKLCASFWNKSVVGSYRYCCRISVNYGIHKKKSLTIKHRKRYFDLLYCRCHNYETYYKTPLSTPETFLIHKSGRSEFYIFRQNNEKLIIKALKGGITLPTPVDEKPVRLRFTDKFVTLCPEHIQIFNHQLTIEKLYPEIISLDEMEVKLIEFEEFNEWPDLQNVDLHKYSMYWGNLCVSLWGEQLNRTHRQACIISPSYAAKKIRKLFIHGRVLYFDILNCKCHSYISNSKQPVSGPDTFQIHQASENEFFVFEQVPTEDSQYTLFIKYLRRVITLPDPELFT